MLGPAKRAAAALLRSVPLGFWERFAPKDVIGLAYHVASDEDLPHQRFYRYKSRAQFESDVVWARDRAISYGEVADRKLRSQPLPPNRIFFSFDDGFAECFHTIRPILRRHGVEAAFFVTTGFLDDRLPFFEASISLCLAAVERLPPGRAAKIVEDLGLFRPRPASAPPNDAGLALRRMRSARVAGLAGPHHRALALWLLGFQEDGAAEIERACALLGVDPRGYARGRPVFMTAAQVRQLASEGFTIGSHGSTHFPRQRMSPEAAERDAVESCRLVQELTGQPKVPFAFPYGGAGLDRASLAGILSRHPFIDLFFESDGLQRDAPFVVSRIWADLPAGAEGGTSNLPLLLRQSWARRPAWYREAPPGSRPPR